MKKMMKRTTFVMVVGMVLIGVVTQGQNKPGVRISIDDILQAHGAPVGWVNVPQTIRIIGNSTHSGVTEPVTITATDKEETAIEYGTKKQVATSKTFFKDDGTKVVHQSTPSGFTQLDVVGVFLLESMKGRKVQVRVGDPVTPAGPRPIYRVHVLSEARSEIHYGNLKVNDEADLFVNDSGVLIGIERTFYPELPRFKATLGYAFSDYRNTGGVLLPYRIDKTIDGVTVESIRVTSYAFNVAASTTLFESRNSR